jgi:integral membrane protein
VNAALTRYRIIAYVVGVCLLILVLIGVPLNHFAHQGAVSAVMGPVHGFLYIVYLFCGYDLARRVGWPWKRTIFVLLAGTIPFLTFVAEHKVNQELRVREPA